MRGRKPKTRRAGEGPPAVRPAVVVDAAAVPAPPDHLPAEAIEVWETAARDLGELLRPSHLPLLEQFAVAVVRHRQAQAILAREGLIVETESGPRPHPAVRIERDASMLCIRLADQFGLSPTARQRLGLGELYAQTLLAQLSERVDAHVEAERKARRRKA